MVASQSSSRWWWPSGWQEVTSDRDQEASAEKHLTLRPTRDQITLFLHPHCRVVHADINFGILSNPLDFLSLPNFYKKVISDGVAIKVDGLYGANESTTQDSIIGHVMYVCCKF